MKVLVFIGPASSVGLAEFGAEQWVPVWCAVPLSCQPKLCKAPLWVLNGSCTSGPAIGAFEFSMYNLDCTWNNFWKLAFKIHCFLYQVFLKGLWITTCSFIFCLNADFKGLNLSKARTFLWPTSSPQVLWWLFLCGLNRVITIMSHQPCGIIIFILRGREQVTGGSGHHPKISHLAP